MNGKLVTLAFAGVFALALTAGIVASGISGDNAETFQDSFRFSARDLKPRGVNDYFIRLKPGFKLLLEGEDEEETVTVLIEVMRGTQLVDGVRSAIVQETEWIDGELAEISRNFFAISKTHKGVFYFGEDVDIYEDGEIVSHEGSWRAGQNGAGPGLIMPGYPIVGSRYFQEVAPGVALDRAEHMSVTETMETPAGTFEDCLLVAETTPLAPEELSIKAYARGIGLIQDGPLKLIDYGMRVQVDFDEGG